MVPKKFPAFPDRQEFDIHAEMFPAKEVGGDFYDFYLIDEGRLGFAIGDVSGKGVPAALFMAVSKTMLKATALKGVQPDDCLQQVNRILHMESLASMFVTLFYGILDTATGQIVYSNGGHLPPLIRRTSGQVQHAESTGGVALGVMANVPYKAKTIQLAPGDCLFLYTDGITEALEASNEEFGDERLQVSLKKPAENIKQLTSLVIEDVRAFSAGTPQSDDITALCLTWQGKK